jgi:hypothetical protein
MIVAFLSLLAAFFPRFPLSSELAFCLPTLLLSIHNAVFRDSNPEIPADSIPGFRDNPELFKITIVSNY